MKRLLIILFFFSSCTIENPGSIEGTWIGIYNLTVLIDKKTEEHIENDSISDELIVEEGPADSVYRIMPSVFEFTKEGRIYSAGSYFDNANWTYLNNEFEINIDSVKLIGKIINSRLFLETIENNKKIILVFEKVNEVDSMPNTVGNVRGKYFRFHRNDSLENTVYFQDSTNVFIRNRFGLNKGQYGFGKLNGIYCFGIFNYYTSDEFGLYLINKKEAVIIEYPQCFLCKPSKDTVNYEPVDLLSKSEINNIKSRLLGVWEFDPLLNKNEFANMEELFFKLNFEVSAFSRILRKEMNSTDEFNYWESKGNWKISPLGDFIELEYIVDDGKHKYDVNSYLDLIEITDSILKIKYSNVSINRYNRFMQGKEIILRRK